MKIDEIESTFAEVKRVEVAGQELANNVRDV
jgi:hypothetical protein